VFGLGSTSSALAGAVTARVDDFAAAFYNPAGLVFGTGEGEVSLGFTGYGSRLSVGGRTMDIADPVAFELGVRVPLPLGGILRDRLAFGFALHMLPEEILRVLARAPTDAFFPYYDNRTQRLVVLPALAGRICDWLAIGIGFNVLAGLDGKVQTTQGVTRVLEPRLDEQIGTFVRLHAGLRAQATRWLSLGLAYRQSFSVPYRVATNNRVAGEDININIEADGLFTPDQLWGGAAARWGELTLSLDAGYLRWSAWHGPYATVSSVLPIAGPFDVNPPAVHASDIYSLRAGGEWRAVRSDAYELALRLGLGFEPSPMPEQPGVTNLVDNDKTIVSGGLGVLFRRLLPAPVRIDAHMVAHVLGDRTYHKRVVASGDPSCPVTDLTCGLHDEVRDNPSDPTTLGTQISNPGYPTLTGGGTVWEGGVTVTLSR
jgi:hypothetical protein